MSNCYVFFGMHSLHSITACWLPDIATTSAASADIWSGHTRRSLYKANIHHTADRMRGGPPGDRKRGVGWGTSVSLSNSTTSDIARAGHQTCKGLTAAKATPTHPCSAALEAQQCPHWRSRSYWCVWSWPSSALPALLCRHRRALGHKTSHELLVWKSTTNFF